MNYDSEEEEDYRQVLQRSVTNPTVDRWGYHEPPRLREPDVVRPRPYEPGQTVERTRMLERPGISNVLPEQRRVRERERSWWDDVTDWFFGREEDDEELQRYYTPAPLPPPPPLMRPLWNDLEAESDDELEPLPPLEKFVKRPIVTRCVLTGDNVEGACLRAEYEVDYYGESGTCHMQWLRDGQHVEFPGAIYPLSSRDVGKVIAVQLTPIGYSGVVGETIVVRGPVIRARYPSTTAYFPQPPAAAPRSVERSAKQSKGRPAPASASRSRTAAATGPPGAALRNCFCGAIVQVALRGLHESQFRFQWYRARFPFPDNNQWFAIEGATSRFYQSTMADLNHHLRCTLTPVNAQEAALQVSNLNQFCGLAPLAKTKLRESLQQAFVKLSVVGTDGTPTSLAFNNRFVLIGDEGQKGFEKWEWSTDSKIVQLEPQKLVLSSRGSRKTVTIGMQHQNIDSVVLSTICIFRLYYAMQEADICVPLLGHAVYKAWKNGDVLASKGKGKGKAAELSALEAAMNDFLLPKDLVHCWGDVTVPPPAAQVQKLLDESKAHGDHWVRSRDVLLAVLI